MSEQQNKGINYIDSRTPEERANEPKITMTTTSPLTMEEIIESIAMAITHSEQGEYAKNEKFVREKISLAVTQALKEQIEEIAEKVNKKISNLEKVEAETQEGKLMKILVRTAFDEVLGLLSNNK